MGTSRRRKGSTRASPTNSPATASVDGASNGIEAGGGQRVEQDAFPEREYPNRSPDQNGPEGGFPPHFLSPVDAIWNRRTLWPMEWRAFGGKRCRAPRLFQPAREAHGATAFATAAAAATTESLSGGLGPVPP